MKSHAMKARAEAEAQAQLQQHKQQHQNQIIGGNRFCGGKSIDLTTSEQQLKQILHDSAVLDDVSPLNLCQSSVAAALSLSNHIHSTARTMPTAAAKINLLNALNAAAASRQQQQANNNLVTKQATQQQQFFSSLQQQQIDMATVATLQHLHSNLQHSNSLGNNSFQQQQNAVTNTIQQSRDSQLPTTLPAGNFVPGKIEI